MVKSSRSIQAFNVSLELKPNNMKMVILCFLLLVFIISLVSAIISIRNMDKSAPVDDAEALEKMRNHFSSDTEFV